MKRSEADVISQKSYTSAETRNAVSHLQAAESLHEISVKTPTLRDYFAAKAMQGWLASFTESDAHPSVSGKCDAVAEASYALADAMLKARVA